MEVFVLTVVLPVLVPEIRIAALERRVEQFQFESKVSALELELGLKEAARQQKATADARARLRAQDATARLTEQVAVSGRVAGSEAVVRFAVRAVTSTLDHEAARLATHDQAVNAAIKNLHAQRDVRELVLRRTLLELDALREQLARNNDP